MKNLKKIYLTFRLFRLKRFLNHGVDIQCMLYPLIIKIFLCWLLLSLLSVNVEAFQGLFAAKVDYGTGTGPDSVAVGDFDQDGYTDLVVANIDPIPGTVSILLNNGNGTFAAKVDYGAGDYLDSVAVGDFDLDGYPDLAVSGLFGHTVSVLLNNGDGTFPVQANYTTGDDPESVAVGDFNLDGYPDLAVANNGDHNVSVLLNKGDGTFPLSGSPVYGTGNNPESVAVGDFNLDGYPDLAVANRTDNNVSVLLNNGDGTFPLSGSPVYGTGTGPDSVAVGDFNQDGYPDLAVTNKDDANVSVLLNNGNGTFAAKVDYGTGIEPFSVAVGDFDIDGYPDLAVANYAGGAGNTVSVLLNDGDGTFATQYPYDTGVGPWSVAVGNFNQYCSPDLAVANRTDNNVSVLLNTVKDYPTIICPSDIRHQATSPSGTSVDLGDPVVTDYCDSNPKITNNAPNKFPLRKTTVTWRVTNFDGYSASCTQEVTIVDTTLPNITCPSNITKEATSPSGTSVDLGSPTVTDKIDPDPNVTNDAPDKFPLRKTTVTWRVTNFDGYSASCTQEVTIVDTTPPNITCPSNITKEATSPSGTSVDLGDPVVTDNCDPDPNVTNDAPDKFPLGKTIVTWTVTDFAGNSASCTQEVTIVDTTPPIIHSVSASPDKVPASFFNNIAEVIITCQVTDNADNNPKCKIIEVTSNEREFRFQFCNFLKDWAITGDMSLRIRACTNFCGQDRIYTITVECKDSSGNKSTSSTEVRVVRNIGRRSNRNIRLRD